MKGKLPIFLLKRFIQGVAVLFVVATLTFIAMKAVPGGPFDQDKSFPEAVKKNIEARYGLDLPLHKQYIRYMVGLAKFDLGPSLKYRSRRVNDILADTFPVSMALGALAFLFAAVLGITAGTWAGLKPRSFADKGGMFVATLGISTPHFVLGTLLILLFAMSWKILPPGLWEGPRSLVLPALTLGFGPAAYIARLTRASVLDVTGMPHVTAAMAKGVPRSRIIIKHILTGAIVPVVTVMGPLLAMLVTGSFVVEFIFAIPGMGKYFITAVTNRDYPLIMGVTMTYSALIVIANIVVDLLYGILDPRISIE